MDSFLPYVFVVVVVLGNVWMCLVFIRRIKNAEPLHPVIRQQDVLFAEKFVSGFSSDHRFFRAENILGVVVSNEAVLVEFMAPFKWFIPVEIDLEQYIPKANIINVNLNSGFLKKTIALEFRSKDGEEKTIELMLRKPQEFMSALRGCG